MVDDTVADAGRLLFRRITGEEWSEHRSIMALFAGTFFSELVSDRLAARGIVLDPAIVGERLESLRRWGNLTVSSATGTPGSLADYYRRRNRYLITRAGQEAHEAIEAVMTRFDEVRDISTGRLRSMRCDPWRRPTWPVPIRCTWRIWSGRSSTLQGLYHRDHAILRGHQPVAQPLRLERRRAHLLRPGAGGRRGRPPRGDR